MVHSQGSNWQLIIIGLGHGLVSYRHQAIICTNDDPVYKYIYPFMLLWDLVSIHGNNDSCYNI